VDNLLEAVLDIQTCTSTMEALAGEQTRGFRSLHTALTPGKANISNAFKSVSGRIIKHLTTTDGRFSAPGSPSGHRDASDNSAAADADQHGDVGSSTATVPPHLDGGQWRAFD
jgi:hypothetical protein